MRRVTRTTSATVVFALVFSMSGRPVLAGTPTDIVTSPGPMEPADRTALTAAVAMLPKAPIRIAVIDVMQNQPPVRNYLLTLDAFTVKDNPVIYIVQQSQLLKGARASSAVHRAMLAVVLWHEMAHLDGADERAARRAEEDLWTRFVRDDVIDRVTGLRVLETLKKRPDDQLFASLSR